jgi:large subunit ribosomal protein L10
MKSRKEKSESIEELKSNFAKANSAFVTHYRGMTVEKLYDLRKKVKAGEGDICVIKNRLAKIAAKGTFLEGIADQFQGPVALVLAYKDPVAVAKAVVESLKDDSPFAIHAGSLEGKVIDEAGIKALSNLPDKQTLLAMLCSALQGPSRNFVNVLAAMPRGMVNVLVAVKDQKGNA